MPAPPTQSNAATRQTCNTQRTLYNHGTPPGIWQYHPYAPEAQVGVPQVALPSLLPEDEAGHGCQRQPAQVRMVALWG
jgi:hypothetical protein